MKKLFKNETAQKYFEYLSSDSDVYESGIDNKGKVYFALLNGNIERYTRRDFIKLSKEFYNNL